MVKLTKQQRELVIVIALALMALGVAYFRFFYEKKSSPADNANSGSATTELTVPQVQLVPPAASKHGRALADLATGIGLRDLFAPSDPSPTSPPESLASAIIDYADQTPRPATETMVVPPAAESLAQFTFSGTILGGKNPIAIINGQFLRVGDEINLYLVRTIEKHRVRLERDDQILALNLVELNFQSSGDPQ